jgi:hypothetical protein
MEIPKFQRPKSQLRFDHNMYDLIGTTLQNAYYRGTIGEGDVKHFLENTLKLDLDYSIGDYGIRAQYNAPDPIRTGNRWEPPGKLDYKIGVRFPINIKGV